MGAISLGRVKHGRDQSQEQNPGRHRRDSQHPSTRRALAATALRRSCTPSQIIENALAQTERSSQRRRRPEQGGRAHELAPALPAHVATVDVARHPLANERRQGAVPPLQDSVQLGAITSSRTAHEQSTERSVHEVTRPVEKHSGVMGTHPKCLAQILTDEPLAKVEVDDGEVSGLEATRSVLHHLC